MPLAMRVAIVLWAVFLTTWVAAGGWAARTKATPGQRRESLYLVLTLVGWALMFAGPSLRLLPALWRNPPAVEWTLVGVIVCGFSFCWWARLHLGKLWSGGVTHKEGHRVVDTGPYRLVRHPIYTGIILSSAAYTVMTASALALAGFVVATTGFWVKARLEERFLSEELGPEAYAAYKARTPMLIPFLPTGAK